MSKKKNIKVNPYVLIVAVLVGVWMLGNVQLSNSREARGHELMLQTREARERAGIECKHRNEKDIETFKKIASLYSEEDRNTTIRNLTRPEVQLSCVSKLMISWGYDF